MAGHCMEVININRRGSTRFCRRLWLRRGSTELGTRDAPCTGITSRSGHVLRAGLHDSCFQGLHEGDPVPSHQSMDPMLSPTVDAHTLTSTTNVFMSDPTTDKIKRLTSDDQQINDNQQTLTLDGRVYAMSALPAEAINVLNDLIRSENELNEHRFRMRQLSAAQQTLTAALNQLVANAGVEPISNLESVNSETEPQESEAA